MRENTLEVERDQRSVKCLLAAAQPDGGLCNCCHRPVPALVDGKCTGCVIRLGINPMQIGYQLVPAQ